MNSETNKDLKIESLQKQIKSLQKENPKGYAAEIKKLKVRLAAINLSKKIKTNL